MTTIEDEQVTDLHTTALFLESWIHFWELSRSLHPPVLVEVGRLCGLIWLPVCLVVSIVSLSGHDSRDV